MCRYVHSKCNLPLYFELDLCDFRESFHHHCSFDLSCRYHEHVQLVKLVLDGRFDSFLFYLRRIFAIQAAAVLAGIAHASRLTVVWAQAHSSTLLYLSLKARSNGYNILTTFVGWSNGLNIGSQQIL